MKILLVDIGNTTADFRFYDSQEEEFFNLIRLSSKNDINKIEEKIINILNQKQANISKIFYVSVVPEWNDIIRSIGKNLNIEVFNIRNIINLNSNNFELDDTSKLGADFICNYYAARHLYNLKNGLIISMGTATTFALIQNKKFIGTIISSGLITSLDGLINNAALLKDNHYFKSDKLIGKNTIDSINIGIYNTHFLMTTAVVDEMKKNFNIDQVIYTGGNSTFFEQEILNKNYTFNERLIFEGIIKIFKENSLNE